MRPNVFVLGAPKAGSTSIHAYLGQHPNVFVSAKKELHYFSRDVLRRNVAGPGDEYALRAVEQTEASYLEHFRAAETQIAVDVSPSYLFYDEVAPHIARFSPNCKAIALVRDPVERAYSQFLHLRREQREELEFEAALDAEPKRIAAGYGDMWRYIESSRYTRHLRAYADVLGRQNLLVLDSQDLGRNPEGTMAEVASFLGIPAIPGNYSQQRNAGGEARNAALARALGQPNALKAVARRLLPETLRGRIALRLVEANTSSKVPMPEAARSRLVEEFSSEAADLGDFLGKPPQWAWIRRE